jgi:hypothetical protein
MEQWIRERIARERMEDASKHVAAIEEQRRTEAAEGLLAYERFYNNLALFSGGTVALSVTFLGYLKSLHQPIAHKQFLFGSWIALLGCLALSLLFTLFIRFYNSYFLNREYMEAMIKKHETEAEEIQHISNIAGIETQVALDEYIGKRRKAISIRRKGAEWNKKRERIYFYAWRWSGLLSRVAFLLGLGLLLVFATTNA